MIGIFHCLFYFTFIFMEICQIMTLLPVSDVISGGAVCLYEGRCISAHWGSESRDLLPQWGLCCWGMRFFHAPSAQVEMTVVPCSACAIRFLWLYYIFWTQARRKAWKTLPGTDESALEFVWIILTMRSFRLFGSYSINPYFLKPPALGGRSLRTHRTDLVSGALMDSSLRDGLQYRQEPGIFMWPLPGSFLYSHLMNIIYENIEK